MTSLLLPSTKLFTPSSKPEIRLLDSVYIFDTNGDRAPGVQSLVQGFADRVDTLLEEGEAFRMVQTNVASDLREGKRVGVIANYYAGVQGGVFAELLKQEESIGKGTRRLLLTCFGDREIAKGLKKRNVPREKVRRIRFSLEEPAHHLEELINIFRT